MDGSSRSLLSGTCSHPYCFREREYFPGCDWSRCCKRCFTSDGGRHEQECDDRWFGSLAECGFCEKRMPLWFLRPCKPCTRENAMLCPNCECCWFCFYHARAHIEWIRWRICAHDPACVSCLLRVEGGLKAIEWLPRTALPDAWSVYSKY